MDKRFGYFVFGGLVIGLIFGMLYAPATDNMVMSILIGAMAGTAIGWFGAAAVMENEAKKKTDSK